MAGKIQPKVVIEGELEVPTEEEGIALALAMCPPGESIELHAAWCDVTDCTCVPRYITKPPTASG